MSKYDFQSIDLGPGRDVYRCRKTGKVLGDGKPFSPQDFAAMGAVEATREPDPEIPTDLAERIDQAHAHWSEAKRLLENAKRDHGKAVVERDRVYREWANTTAAVDGLPPAELKAYDDAVDEAWKPVEEALEAERLARVQCNELAAERDRHRRAAELERQHAADQAARPSKRRGIAERIRALGGAA